MLFLQLKKELAPLKKKKIVSVIPDAIFLALMAMPNSKRICMERLYRGSS